MEEVKLNDRDRAVYECIRQGAEVGVMPTVREICKMIGNPSTSTIHRSIQRLADAGLIEKPNTHLNRAIKLVGEERGQKVPILGTVTAGQPITAIQEIEGYLNFTSSKHYDGKLFALKVRGESMINAAILDGDTVVVEQCSTAEDGEIVVALVDEEDATVKRFYKEDGHYRLQPENDEMEPIISDTVSIIGRVVAVIRYLED